MSMEGAGECPLCGAFSDYCEVSFGVDGATLDCRDVIAGATDELKVIMRERHNTHRDIMRDCGFGEEED